MYSKQDNARIDSQYELSRLSNCRTRLICQQRHLCDLQINIKADIQKWKQKPKSTLFITVIRRQSIDRLRLEFYAAREQLVQVTDQLNQTELAIKLLMVRIKQLPKYRYHLDYTRMLDGAPKKLSSSRRTTWPRIRSRRWVSRAPKKQLFPPIIKKHQTDLAIQ